jgi:type II secretory pathway pseudopilin PulG
LNIQARVAEQRRQAGFSLLEVLIAVTLFMIITGAIFALIGAARLDRITVNQRAEMVQNLRVAMNAMGRDALNAGFRYTKVGGNLPDNQLNSLLGLPTDSNTTADVLPAIVSGKALNDNTLNPDTNAANRKTDQVTFVYQYIPASPTPSPTPFDTLSISAISANQLTIQSPATNAGVNTNDLYLIVGNNSQAIGMVTGKTGTDKIDLASTDPLTINKTSSGGNVIKNVPAPATITKIRLVTFKVLTDGTLVRIEYGNDTGTKQEQPLAYGIEKMVVEYVLADGTLTRDPAAGTDGIYGNGDDTPSKLNNVRQVRITLTARSIDKDTRVNDFHRVTLTGTYNTRNLSY